MIFNMTGGGGASLNFKVTAYATEAALLAAAPAENTIGVITTTATTSWIFSAEEPAPAAGMVWITTSTSSAVSFNALKKNGVMVYPLAAKQYIGGEWVDKTAKIYQDGAWKEWETYLYLSGNEFVELTGGWEVSKTCGGTIVKNADSITLDISGVSSQNTYGAVNTVNPIDLTKVSMLAINDSWLESVEGTVGSYVFPRFGVAKEKPRSRDDFVSPVAYIASGGLLDVSNLSGTYYVFIGAGFNGLAAYKANMKITEVKVK